MKIAGAQAGAARRFWLIVPILVVLVGCAGRTKRVDPDALAEKEAGTGLTSQDFRSVCQRMARSLLNVPEIQHAAEPPLVAIAPVVNDSNDYIDGTEFARKIRTELIKYAEGRVRFLDRELTRRIDDENRDKRRGKITGGEASSSIKRVHARSLLAITSEVSVPIWPVRDATLYASAPAAGARRSCGHDRVPCR